MNTSQFFKPSRRGGGGGLKSREITTLNCSRVVTRKPQHHAHNDLRITSLEADVVHIVAPPPPTVYAKSLIIPTNARSPPSYDALS